jgi:hypothetical protein
MTEREREEALPAVSELLVRALICTGSLEPNTL